MMKPLLSSEQTNDRMHGEDAFEAGECFSALPRGLSSLPSACGA